MNKYKTLTPLEIHQIGLDALTKELGLSGMMQFIKFFDKGSGNYTKERAKLLNEETVDELVSNIYRARTNKLK